MNTLHVNLESTEFLPFFLPLLHLPFLLLSFSFYTHTIYIDTEV